VVKAALVEEEASAAARDEIVSTLNIPKVFAFPYDAKYDAVLGRERDPCVFGIDISHYTGRKLDLSSLRAQRVEFVYVKATQGTGFKDELFSYYWPRLGVLPPEQRVYRGAYHFLSAVGGSGTAQAQRFASYVNLYGGFASGDMPPCLDLEWDRTRATEDQWKGQDPNKVADVALECLDRIETETGRTPCLYTARSWWRSIGLNESRFNDFSRYKAWIADYSISHKAREKPSVPLDKPTHLWQFASDATLTAGYKGGVDANIYKGTKEQFRTDFGLG
jgi:lysozyme